MVKRNVTASGEIIHPPKLRTGGPVNPAAKTPTSTLVDDVAALKAEIADLKAHDEIAGGDYAYLMGKVSRLRHENADLRRASKINTWMLGASMVMNLVVLGKLRSLR